MASTADGTAAAVAMPRLGQQPSDRLASAADLEGPTIGGEPLFVKRQTGGGRDGGIELGDRDAVRFHREASFVRCPVDLSPADSSADQAGC